MDKKKAIKKIYSAGFTELMYKGAPVVNDAQDNAVIIPVKHIRFKFFNQNGNGRHGCLVNGFFCWSNLIEHPLDIFEYLKQKIKATE